METLFLQSPDREKRAISRALRAALILSVGLAAVLLVMLATASGNTSLLERHFPTLWWISVGVASGLGILVLELIRRLYVRHRKRIFGTRLMARMAAQFIAMTVIPLALLYTVSVQFIERSIESWFDVPVERALDSGLKLGQATLESLLSDLTQKARSMAGALSDLSPDLWASALNRLRDQAGVQEALVASGTGRIIAASGNQYARLLPDMPPAIAMRQARVTRQFAAIEGGDTAGGGDKSLKMRVIVAVNTEGQRLDDARFLQLVQPVPTTLAENAEAVQQGFRDYQELSLSRAGLKRIFRVTLTLTFFLTVFAAVAAAFVLAGWLTGPLSQLAAATKAVAEGDFRPVKDYRGRDELGVLTQSFNAMTRQLEEARSQVERNQRDLEQANARLESILANLSAGVLVLDSDLRLTLANQGAERILGIDLNRRHLGQALVAIPRLDELADLVRRAFNEQAAAGVTSWQRQFELRPMPKPPAPVPGADSPQGPPTGAGGQAASPLGPLSSRETSGPLAILARGTILPERRVGYVIVFDDISQIVSAQRAVAWAEVARRLAHEIKNPLTPIQLAAERLKLKLAHRLPPAESEMLDKSAQTIINQVAALKMMVDEFRDYARLPAARLAPLALNPLIEDVLGLYAGHETRIAIHVTLADNVPEVLGDATQLRQVFHNLIKNALEATEKATHPAIEVVSEPVRMPDDAPAARVIVRDNGGGFSPAMLARAFEPYATSKPRGTGLGLAIVKKIADEHGARVDCVNWAQADGEPIGAQVSILFTKLAKTEDNPPHRALAQQDN